MHCLSITFYHGSFAHKYVVGYQFKIFQLLEARSRDFHLCLFHWVQYQRVGPVNRWQNSVTLNVLLF